MLYRGENITRSNTEILERRSVYEIYKEISKSESDLSVLVSRIRKVAGIDHSACQSLKKQLPFFAISFFGDKPRNTENFVHASYFIIDIDNCYENESNFIMLRNRIAQDPRVHLMFTSPGGAGLKLLFPLDEECVNTKFFSDAYRSFTSQLSRDINLEKKVDLSTSDVTRVCFLSYDKMAYYNPLPEKVCWKAYLPSHNLFTESKENDDDNGEYITTQLEIAEISNSSNDIHPDIYRAILKKLNPDGRYPVKKEYYVPEILNSLEEPVRDAVTKHSISISEIRDIHYGRKFCFSHGLHKAEINIYYGSKGFSVVITPGNGTHPELNKIVHTIVSDLIFTPKFRLNYGS